MFVITMCMCFMNDSVLAIKVSTVCSLGAPGMFFRDTAAPRNPTQEKLAELADIHLRTLEKIDAGEINLLLTTVLRIKRALKCPWVKLLG